jgi:hypothetical protein
MKDTFDAVDDIQNLINVPEITGVFGARFWKHYLPTGLKGLNIVIRMTSGTHQYIQNFNINVNLHVPNITSNGVHQVADLMTFDRLNKALIPLLDARYKYDYWTEVLRTSKVYKEPDMSHFQTIQVKYRSINLTNNI